MANYSRQKRYRDKRRAEGLCRTCDTYTPTNPKTEQPFWYCRYCRTKASDRRIQLWRQTRTAQPDLFHAAEV